jgi:hypothetical protein
MCGRVAALVAAAALALFVDLWFAGSGNARALARHGKRTTATIISIEDPMAGVYYPDVLPIVTYSFKLQAKRYDGLGRVDRGRFARLSLGGKIEVLYLPERPNINALAEGAKRPSPGLTAGAFVAIANGLVGVALVRVVVVLTRPRPHRLARFRQVSR